MLWLSTSTIARLRDQLKNRGRHASVAPAPGAAKETIEMLAVMAEYGPLCEAMYLMMSADGKISTDEREVLKGALRNLSGDAIRQAHVEALLDAAGKSVADDGREVRMQEVVAVLKDDPARAEVAFVLAAAIAFADNAIADEENETLNQLAEGLGISEVRANELLDDVESDLSRNRPGG